MGFEIGKNVTVRVTNTYYEGKIVAVASSMRSEVVFKIDAPQAGVFWINSESVFAID